MVRAAEIYHSGLAPVLLPSGGTNPHLSTLTEWEHLKNLGIALGVPEQAFLKEDKAQNTLENAQLSWRAIVEAGIEVHTAILVCKAFHARRAHMTYSSIFPSQIQFMVSPIQNERNIRKDNWYTNKIGISIVMGEVEKIGKYFGPYIEQMLET